MNLDHHQKFKSKNFHKFFTANLVNILLKSYLRDSIERASSCKQFRHLIRIIDRRSF